MHQMLQPLNLLFKGLGGLEIRSTFAQGERVPQKRTKAYKREGGRGYKNR